MTYMKYQSADVTDVDRFIADDGWAMEQKLDGVRCIAKSPGNFYSHSGAPLRSGVRHHYHLARAMSTAPLSVVLDGELMENGDLWVFDLCELGGNDTTHLPFQHRRHLLEYLFDGWTPERIFLVDSFTDPAAKRALWERVVDSGAEGVVVKRLTGRYQSKGRTADVLKVKVTKTIDVIVTGYGDDTNSARLSLLRDGDLIEVGKCSLNGKVRPAVGDVLEVEYLYVVDPDAPRLYQGRMLRIRSDKSPLECGWDQLPAPTTKEVIAA